MASNSVKNTDKGHEIFVPGRLCIMGEHTDWAATYRCVDQNVAPGMTIICTTHEGIYARATSLDKPVLLFECKSTNGRYHEEQDGNESLYHDDVDSDFNIEDAIESSRERFENPALYRATKIAQQELLKEMEEELGEFDEEESPPAVKKQKLDTSQSKYIAIPLVETDLKKEAKSKSFFSYAAGTALAVIRNYGDLIGSKGIHINNYRMTLPMQKGLSSSAAICCLVVKAFDAIFNLNLTLDEVMELAYLGEMETPSECGKMDQCCALGENSIALMMFDGKEVSIKPIAPAAPLHFVVADLNASKCTVTILRSLNQCFSKEKGGLPPQGQEIADKFYEFVNSNSSSIWNAIRAIESGNASDLGKIMLKAQDMFDSAAIPACPKELTSPKLHSLMNNKDITSLSYGSKGVGSQGDGSIQILAKGPTEQAALVEYLSTSLGLHAFPLTVDPPPSASTSCLAQLRCRIAVIVAAGLSTRMFPASAVVKKELFPIVDSDGICKPVILAIIEELVQSGIEKIVLVVQEKDIDVFDSFFQLSALGKNTKRLKPHQQVYAKRIQALRSKISYSVQETQDGFGHAVWCAKENVMAELSKETQNEPFLLLLGDHLYKKGHGSTKTCATQLIETYLNLGEAGKPAIGLKVMPESQISSYGVCAGTKVAEPPKRKKDPHSQEALSKDSPHHLIAGRSYNIDRIAEKPSIELAQSNLQTEDLETPSGEKGYLVVFGQYLLPAKRTFDILERNIKEDRRSLGEIQFTTVLEEMCREDGNLLGYVMNGEALDMGIPQPYIHTMERYSREHCI